MADSQDSRPENPPAFPTLTEGLVSGSPNRDGDHCVDFRVSGGMSLRDYFAAAAMQACWTNENNRNRALTDAAKRHVDLYRQIAVEAYALADAMLAERAKGGR